MSSPINFREQELSHMVGPGTMASPVNFRDVVSIWVSFMSSLVNHGVNHEFASPVNFHEYGSTRGVIMLEVASPVNFHEHVST